MSVKFLDIYPITKRLTREQLEKGSRQASGAVWSIHTVTSGLALGVPRP